MQILWDAFRYHLHNFKKEKNTQKGVLLLVKSQALVTSRKTSHICNSKSREKSKVNANTQRTKLKFNILFRILSGFKLSINLALKKFLRKYVNNYFSWENYLLLNLQEFVFIRYDFDLMIIMNDLLNLFDSCWFSVAPSLLFYLFTTTYTFPKV